MSKKRPLIVLTRPQAQSERFAQMCREALGPEQQIILSPLLKIEMLPFQADVTQYRGLIFTSENGVRAFSQTHDAPDMPAYCVGERTAKAARAAGFEAISADGSASDLVAMINAADETGPFLHVRGTHTRGEIASGVAVQVEQIVAYRQTALSLTGEAISALQGSDKVILPLFSPRTAQLLFEQVGQITAPLQMIAMSEAVNEVILGSNKANIANNLISNTADAPAMLHAIKSCIGTI